MYLLKSAACMSILLLFYKLLLEKENMHVLKRFYLLAVPMISFGIPVISFPEYITVTSEGTAFLNETVLSTGAADFPLFEWSLLGIYFLGVLFFGSRFLFNLRSLLKRARKNPKVKITSATHVLLKDDVSPHTFWSYIYLNRKKFERNQIPKEVMDHELAHVRQKHTADILFMELLQVLLWFLPLVYLLKKAVRLNHEFLADSAALRTTENIRTLSGNPAFIFIGRAEQSCQFNQLSINQKTIYSYEKTTLSKSHFGADIYFPAPSGRASLQL